ncbi:MAG: alpha/beta hydrolase fold domain-containing protein, partial [Eubacteriales bacterium]
MRKVVKAVLKACSIELIDVEKDRKRANLKAIGARKYTHSTIDQNVANGKYLVPVRVYFPNHDTLEEYKNDEANLPVIIYLHGGGWVTDGIDNYERICDKLAKYTNHIIVSVDYRLAPEHKFPIGLEDCYEVAKAICLGNFPGIAKHADVTIMGDSAGGNLATVVCQMARDKKEFSLTRQVLIYPVVYN